MNREGHCFDPTIRVGMPVKLDPRLWWARHGMKEGIVIKIAGIFAYVNLGKQTAAIHMNYLLPCG